MRIQKIKELVHIDTGWRVSKERRLRMWALRSKGLLIRWAPFSLKYGWRWGCRLLAPLRVAESGLVLLINARNCLLARFCSCLSAGKPYPAKMLDGMGYGPALASSLKLKVLAWLSSALPSLYKVRGTSTSCLREENSSESWLNSLLSPAVKGKWISKFLAGVAVPRDKQGSFLWNVSRVSIFFIFIGF